MKTPILFSELQRRMVVVAPHADDEILGAGGLLAQLAADKWNIHVLYMTISGFRSQVRGDTSGTGDREAEVRKALGVLGIERFDALHRGEEYHLRLDTRPQSELIGFVEQALAETRPSVVLMPGRGHYHQDHRASADACIAALRPSPDGPRPFVPVVLAYGHQHPGWGGSGMAFEPTAFVNIDDAIETKLEGMAAYASQMLPPPSARSPEGIRAWAAAWGPLAGCTYAEPYEVLRVRL